MDKDLFAKDGPLAARLPKTNRVIFLFAPKATAREAAGLVSALRALAGPSGTLAAPADSPAGRILREEAGTRVSRHPTHAVAVLGRKSAWFTAAHGRRGRRPGPYGDRAFAAESPFEKLCDANCLVVLAGEDREDFFLPQLEAHHLVNRYLYPTREDPAAGHVVRDPLKKTPDGPGVWPVPEEGQCEALLKEKGLLFTAAGETPFTAFFAGEYLAEIDCALETEPEKWLDPACLTWLTAVRGLRFYDLRDFAYEARLRARFRFLLPEKVTDSHFHVSLHGVREPRDADWYASLSEVVGARISDGLMMDSPSREVADDFEGYNEKIIALARRRGCHVGMMTPACVGYDRAKALIERFPDDVRCIKPYFTYAPAGVDRFECDMLDFAPEWMFRLADEKQMPVLVHLSHYARQCEDPRNVTQIRQMALRYPNMKLVLAHCAMGHNYDRLRAAIPRLADLRNLYVDASGVTDPTAIAFCVKYLGAKRVLYGGDYDFGDVLGRIHGQGGNFFALHPDLSTFEGLPGDYHFVALSNLYEGMLAVMTALDLLDAPRADYDRIFWRNHQRVYGKHL